MPDSPVSAVSRGDRNRRPGWVDLGVAAALLAAVAAIYGQVVRNRFVYLDDNLYIFANPVVSRGLSRDGLVWAFTAFHADNWHPLTWLSLMLDCQLFGATQDAAGAHHLVSAGLHGANAILLFFALRYMTGDLWPSAFVSALFAVHPLRVESVAWASERKDVLSGFFFMLTLLAYARYAKQPRVAAYLPMLAAAVLGLLSKPMLVTLPFVLVLLDLWPLRRWSPGVSPSRRRRRGAEGGSRAPASWPLRRLLLEKLPLLAAVAAVSVLTVCAQMRGSVFSLKAFPFPWRIVNAAIAYVTYLGKTFWPSDLAPLYLHPATFPSARIESFLVPSAASALFLASITILVLRQVPRRPYWLTGWLWYLGMLVPVVGLMQVGIHSWADRYAYLPLIGVYVMVAWGAGGLVAHRAHWRRGVGVAACASLVLFAVAARSQVAMWRDTRTLFEHTVRATRDNWVIENLLGALVSNAEPASADARRHLEEALRIRPDHVKAHVNLAKVLLAQGSREEARGHLDVALRLDPDLAEAHIGLGNLLAGEGNVEQAMGEYEKVLRRDPKNVDAHASLGIVLASGGKPDAARVHIEEALRLDPNSVLAQNALARWLVTASDPGKRDPRRALELARRAAAQTEFRWPAVLATLAAAYAAAGEFRQAVAWQRRVLELAPEQDQASHRDRLRQYQAGRSLTDGATDSASSPRRRR